VAKDNRTDLIAQYREGAAVLAAAVAGLSDEELDNRPADGGWSAREVVHHTADSEMTSAVRLRRLVAEDSPAIAGYDADVYAAALHYRTRPIQPSLEAIRYARGTTADILDALSDDAWERAGTHSEMGPYSIDTWLEIYARHCHDHAEQAKRAVAERQPA
jgi:hypothetical protein